VNLQPYLFFDDMCYLTIKVEKQLKGQKHFQTASSIRPSSTPKGHYAPKKAITIRTPFKTLDKGKGIANEWPKRLEGRWTLGDSENTPCPRGSL